jgi:hypothetical protein
MDPIFVLVKWEDAFVSGTESIKVSDAHLRHRPSLQETAGWLLIDDEVGVSIANERCLDEGDEEYRGRTFIPRSLVKSVTPVNLTKPRKPKPKDTT